MYFEIYKSHKNDQYWFVIKSSNHKSLASSEMYVSKQSVLNALEIIAEGRTVDCYDKTGE